MGISKGRSARMPVKAAALALFRATGAKTLAVPTGSAALSYAVGVWGDVPQAANFPYVRVDVGLETTNSTMGRNGKKVEIIAQVFDNVESDERRGEIASRLIALANPEGNYAPLTVAGYTTENVQFDRVEERDPDELAGRKIGHTSVFFDVLVEESA